MEARPEAGLLAFSRWISCPDFNPGSPRIHDIHRAKLQWSQSLLKKAFSRQTQRQISAFTRSVSQAAY